MSRPPQTTIEHATQTGFQSACAEYAEKPLSMAEFFETLNPAVIQVRMTKDMPALELKKGDLLHVRMDLIPKPDRVVLAIAGDEMHVFKYKQSPRGMQAYFTEEQLNDTKFGVIILQSRDHAISHSK